MAVRPNSRFSGSLFAKTGSEGALPLKVTLVADVSGQVLASASVQVGGTSWKKYKFEMQSGNVAASSENHLEILIDKPATLRLHLVFVFPPTYKAGRTATGSTSSSHLLPEHRRYPPKLNACCISS
jgi:hypothetical protein